MSNYWTYERPKCKAIKTLPEGIARVQGKRDGYRLTLFKDDTGRAYAFGRDVREDLEYTARFPLLLDTTWFRSFAQHAPAMSSVDGEMWVPGKRASFVPTALRDVNAGLRFDAFSATMHCCGGHSLSFAEVDTLCKTVGIQQVPWYTLENFERMLVTAPGANWFEKANATAVAHGDLEGWVLKQSAQDGWFKVKAEETADCIITDIKPGKPGKYFGLLGALIVSVWKDGQLVEVGNASGMDDAMREQLSAMDEKDLLGKVVEIKFQYLGDGQRMRHPRFVRMRDDKPAHECSWEQFL